MEFKIYNNLSASALMKLSRGKPMVARVGDRAFVSVKKTAVLKTMKAYNLADVVTNGKLVYITNFKTK